MAFLKYPHTFIRLQRQVKEVTSLERMLLEWGRRISEVLKREQARLRNFIRRVEVNRLLTAIDHFSPDAGPAALLRPHRASQGYADGAEPSQVPGYAARPEVFA